DLLVIDLARVGHLHELTVAPANHRARSDDEILKGHRHGSFQDVLEDVAMLAQAQLVDEQPHGSAVTDVADGLVVELAHAALERVAQRTQASARVERLVLYAVEQKLLVPLERQELRATSVMDGVTRVAILVDQTVRGPREV